VCFELRAYFDDSLLGVAFYKSLWPTQIAAHIQITNISNIIVNLASTEK